MFNGKHVENYSHFSFPPLTSIKKKQKQLHLVSFPAYRGVTLFFANFGGLP